MNNIFIVKSLLIERNNHYSLIIRKPRIHSLFSLIFYFLFCSFWYILASSLLLPNYEITSWQNFVNAIQSLFQNDLFESMIFCIVYLVPLLAIPQIIITFLILIKGKFFCFNSLDKTISINHKVISGFDQVENLLLKRYYHRKTPDSYKLSISLYNGRKITIDESSDFELICNAADAIANILNVAIIKKN